MRIMYLHQYFITRQGVGGTRSYEFARYMVGRGHEVIMVTAADPTSGRGSGLINRREVDGIDVVEVRAGYSDYLRGTTIGYLARIRSFLQFAFACSRVVRKLPRPDLVFATSPPLTIGIPALVASKRHKAPLVFEVRDLWPEAAIQMGALRNPGTIAFARALERAIYRNSSHVIALSPGMRDGILAAGMRPEQVSVIPNASDLELFSPEVNGEEVRARLGINGQFVCSYFGVMGEANDLNPVVEAARLLEARGEKGIVFVLHGKGKRRVELESLCRSHNLTNVIFSDPIPDKHAVARLAAASDVCMTIYKNVPILYTCSPNKLFDTFAAGRAALVNSPGWLKDLVEQHEAGLYVRPDDAEHLADRVVFLRDHPELVKTYGRNARRLAEESFDRKKLAAQLLSVFEQVVSR
ncbi:MAG TPA: glycosyltransferase family 4 protein [Blastocatellia bacterium]|nr:glycosyltransferase family 4 protein [Blastocatellia bacterium]